MTTTPTKTFKILALLLGYPSRELQEAVTEFPAVLEREELLGAEHRSALAPLIDELAAHDLYALQARYVDLFDRSRSLSLHLFEHIHGESRDRGPALVDLGMLYARHGFEAAGNELPDYLPVFLEFLACLPLEQARELLAQPGHIIAALKERHAKRESAYTPVFAAIEALGEWRPERAEVEELLSEPEDDPFDLEALDAVWEEAPVTFGPGSGCPQAGVGGPNQGARS